jgi:hypothetical protein
MEIADGVRVKVNRGSILTSAVEAKKKAEASEKPAGG